MTKLYEVDKCNHCPFFVRTLGCTRVSFPKPRQVPVKIEQWEDENGKHDHRHYPVPDWCPLPDKEADMKVNMSKEPMVLIEDYDGRVFRLERTRFGKIRITVPEDRIMYRTEQGLNNADFVELVK